MQLLVLYTALEPSSRPLPFLPPTCTDLGERTLNAHDGVQKMPYSGLGNALVDAHEQCTLPLARRHGIYT